MNVSLCVITDAITKLLVCVKSVWTWITCESLSLGLYVEDVDSLVTYKTLTTDTDCHLKCPETKIYLVWQYLGAV